MEVSGPLKAKGAGQGRASLDDMWTRGAFFFPVGCTDLKPNRVVSGAKPPPLHTYWLR